MRVSLCNPIESFEIWEKLNNPNFNSIEFDGFRILAGLNRFTLSAIQWREKTGAIRFISKPGRYGGTDAHKDVAFEFDSWVSLEFKLSLKKNSSGSKKRNKNYWGGVSGET